LKLTSCNTTGLIRGVDALDRLAGVEKVVITIVRRVADPGDTHRGLTNEALLDTFREHSRIRVFRIADGFNSNAALFKYARDLGNKRADMYEIGVWKGSFGTSGDDILFAISIPQEAVTIREAVDGIRAVMEMQTDRLEAVGLTNRYLDLKSGR
jgi:glyceraldehyde-3-phosphate dehydrogenase (NAD(P))